MFQQLVAMARMLEYMKFVLILFVQVQEMKCSAWVKMRPGKEKLFANQWDIQAVLVPRLVENRRKNLFNSHWQSCQWFFYGLVKII